MISTYCLFEFDVDEHYDTAKNAVKTGAGWLAKKADEGYEKVKSFGKRVGRYIARGGGDSEEHKAKLARDNDIKRMKSIGDNSKPNMKEYHRAKGEEAYNKKLEAIRK